MVYNRDPAFIKKAFEDILRDRFQGDDYTIRLWEAEATLQSIGYERGYDGRWRKKPTQDDMNDMIELKKLGEKPKWVPFADQKIDNVISTVQQTKLTDDVEKS